MRLYFTKAYKMRKENGIETKERKKKKEGKKEN